jgi:hypothetical protein
MLLVVEEIVLLCANPVQLKQIKKRVKSIFISCNKQFLIKITEINSWIFSILNDS